MSNRRQLFNIFALDLLIYIHCRRNEVHTAQVTVPSMCFSQSADFIHRYYFGTLHMTGKNRIWRLYVLIKTPPTQFRDPYVSFPTASGQNADWSFQEGPCAEIRLSFITLFAVNICRMHSWFGIF